MDRGMGGTVGGLETVYKSGLSSRPRVLRAVLVGCGLLLTLSSLKFAADSHLLQLAAGRVDPYAASNNIDVMEMGWRSLAEDARDRAVCPPDAAIEQRPRIMPPELYGTGCEPGWTLEVVQLVGKALQALPGERVGVEWGAGASTHWLLRDGRLTRLHTIEHRQTTLTRINATISGAGRLGWAPQLVPPAGPVKTYLQAESYEHFFREYVDAPLPPKDSVSFVCVGGMARMAALRRAVGLLRPADGVLVLPNSQREHYASASRIVPPHWHKHTSGDKRGATTLWISRHAD